jgi:hypothetical protein
VAIDGVKMSSDPMREVLLSCDGTHARIGFRAD